MKFDSSNYKVGDNVIVCNYKEDDREITKIRRITPTGRIQVDCLQETYFNKQGEGMGWFNYLTLEPLPYTCTTEETLKEDLILRIRSMKLTTSSLLLINEILVDSQDETD